MIFDNRVLSGISETKRKVVTGGSEVLCMWRYTVFKLLAAPRSVRMTELMKTK